MYAAPLFAAASEDIPLIDIDHTLWVQLAIFLVLMLVLTKVVFGPYLRLREAREEGTTGARAKAKDLGEEASRVLAEYESRLLAARQRGAEERERLRREALSREREILERMRAEVGQVTESAKSQLAKEVAELRAEMAPKVNEIASLVVKKMLGRDSSCVP